MASFNSQLSGKLLVTVATVVSIPAALYVGRLAGQANVPKLTMILGGLFGMLVVLGMGQKIWLLIPAAFALNLPPLPFAGRQLQLEEVATAAAFGVFVIGLAMRKLSLRAAG
jgi:hypothetical protein